MQQGQGELVHPKYPKVNTSSCPNLETYISLFKQLVLTHKDVQRFGLCKAFIRKMALHKRKCCLSLCVLYVLIA